MLAAGSIDLTNTDGKYRRSIQLWNLDTGEQLRKIETGLLATSSLTFSPDGRKLISGMNDGTLLVWDIEKLNKLAQAKAVPVPATTGEPKVDATPKSKLDGKSVDRESKSSSSQLGSDQSSMTSNSDTLLEVNRVVDAHGKPISGAKIELLHYEVKPNKVLATFYADEQGRFDYPARRQPRNTSTFKSRLLDSLPNSGSEITGCI